MKLTMDPDVVTGSVRADETGRGEVTVVAVMPGIHRVERDGLVVGYVIQAERVHVALRGAVYNTAVEIAQSLDFDVAVRALAGR